jgi:hypothetical protein
MTSSPVPDWSAIERWMSVAASQTMPSENSMLGTAPPPLAPTRTIWSPVAGKAMMRSLLSSAASRTTASPEP